MLAELRTVVEKHWGYRTFRPLQEEAMRAMLACRDSVVVLPTGGGKSLCYQAPAVVRGGTTVVVSPLISLMKDQVDALRSNGIVASQIDSSMSPDERRSIEQDMREGTLRLLFVSPERLVTASFQALLREAGVNCFAIDEAHCISHWGHDFRPEYRQLGQIKQWFPGAAVHAYTATATERVRDDIVRQLHLDEPEILVGNFDRPNLIYRVVARREETKQVIEVIDRHKGDAGIIYCIRRKDVDSLAAELVRKGYKARPYHAGMTPDQRRKAQDAFAAERCDLIVATVAFGMGIDRSNIRFVLHTGMPKSVEAYQQETGRAGREGLEAECVLLYSGADAMVWRSIVEKSAAEARAAGTELDPDFVPVALQHIGDMDRYARGAACRHAALVEYFGQELDKDNCAACDLCLGDREPVTDSLIIAQKILSCVARVKERFGITHVIAVLRGSDTERIRSFGHDKLPTYGLLAGHPEGELRDWIFQLVGQKVLVQEPVEINGQSYPILRLNEASWEVMRKQRDVRLVQPVRKEKLKKASRDEAVSWEGVDQELFEALRGLRRQLAAERGVQPYVIFSDATLRELARVRPSSLERMRYVYGIGERKLRDFGERVLGLIRGHCAARTLSMDKAAGTPVAAAEAPRKSARANSLRAQCYEMFRRGAALEDVMAAVRKTRGTVVDYLCEFIRDERPASVGPWVNAATYQRVQALAVEAGTARLKPIFLALGENVEYDAIRIVVAHMDAGK